MPEGRTTFPARATPRRRRRRNLRAGNNAVALPSRESTKEEAPVAESEAPQTPAAADEREPEPQSEVSTIAAPSEPETPATSQAPSESDYTNVSTPATPAPAPVPSPKPTPTQQPHARRATRTAIAVPSIPGLAKPKEASPPSTSHKEAQSQAGEETTPKPEEQAITTTEETAPLVDGPAEAEAVKTPEAKPVPKSWADLVKRNAPKTAALAAGLQKSEVVTNGFQLPKSASLADALKQYSVNNDAQLNFLEPRGLVNTGNMCYMNSVSCDLNYANRTELTSCAQILQVLVFCVPFYTFLDQVRQRTVYSMKSDTPLVDAMIMFMREFKSLASADTADVLRSSLKQEQLEQYGESITPDYVYEVIRKLPRFASMRVSCLVHPDI